MSLLAPRPWLLLALLAAVGCSSSKDAPAARRADAPPPQLHWSRAYIVKPAGSSPAAMYVVIDNPTAQPDTLIRVTTSLVDVAVLHSNMSHSGHGAMSMVPISTLVIPADTVVQLQPGGVHVMLTHLTGPIARGDSIDVTLHFAKRGAVPGYAAVITYADVDSATAPATALTSSR